MLILITPNPHFQTCVTPSNAGLQNVKVKKDNQWTSPATLTGWLGYYRAGPALEGTACGAGFWCRSGKCVKNVKPAVDGSADPGVSLCDLPSWFLGINDRQSPSFNTNIYWYILCWSSIPPKQYCECLRWCFRNGLSGEENPASLAALRIAWGSGSRLESASRAGNSITTLEKK